MLRLIVTLMAGGMFAGAVTVGRLALRRLLRRGSIRPPALSPVPPDWLPYLDRHVPAVRYLSSAQRERLLVKTQQLMEGCHWEGCAGLQLTDAMRLTIAAQACLLVLEHDGDPYPEVETILVYPGTFRPRQFSWTPSADAWEEDPALGESWHHGVVILAWDSAAAGSADPADGKNVVFHEFAHQLDSASGETDGVPHHLPSGAYEPWSRMLERDFSRLVAEAEQDRQGVLDHYGATDHTEFFAVATEAFFERPVELQRERPELYQALREYYRQDPASRRPS